MLVRRQREVPAKLVVTLAAELTARVYRHHREGALPGTPQDTARELISAALDFPEVSDSLLRSARFRAFGTVRREFWALTNALISDLEAAWQRQRNVVPLEVPPDGVDDWQG